MLTNFLMVSQQVLILFILIGIGFACQKIGFLTQKTVKGIANIVLYIVTPCIIIQSFQRSFDSNGLKNLGIVALIAFLVQAVSIFLAHLTVFDKDDNRQRVLRFSTVFSNCGYMSLPLQLAIVGSVGVFYGAVYIAVFNIILWSYGVFVMTGDKKSVSIKKLILNPGVIGVTVGLLFFVFSIKLPTIAAKPIEYMAALNTPLPMLIIGFYLAQISFKNIFKDLKKYLVIFLRLVVIPFVTLGALILIGIKGDVLVVCVIASSAPVAAAATMFATKFDRDANLASSLVSVSTLLSVVSMPFIVGLAQYLK